MKTLLLTLLLSAAAYAQGPADCTRTFSISNAALTSAPLPNVNSGCVSWVITYTSSGYSAVTLAVQSAPDVSGTAGTFVTFAGTVDSGINPNTNTAQETATLTGYYPWVRVALTAHTGTGTITGVLYGYKTGGSGGGGGGSVPVPLPVIGPGTLGDAPSNTPVQIGGDAAGAVTGVQTDPAGHLAVVGPDVLNTPPATNPLYVAGRDQSGNLRPVPLNSQDGNSLIVSPLHTCALSVPFNISSSGNVEIVGATPTVSIHICKFMFSTTAPENIKLTTGTGSDCGTGTADVTGLFMSIQSAVLPLDGTTVPFEQALCINTSAGTDIGGQITYDLY